VFVCVSLKEMAVRLNLQSELSARLGAVEVVRKLSKLF
jgi:hypothetical protein